uniref:CopG family transcriptional regulator n=1 Tax=Schlesneria paludicola TaxID=360056 RepID=A0A7C2K161_9PLAN
MAGPELRKQISLFLPVADWLALRREAARRRMPITRLCVQWLEPELEHLRRHPPDPLTDDDAIPNTSEG